MNPWTDRSRILLDFVSAIGRQKIDPEQAMTWLRRLKDEFADCGLELTWELDNVSGLYTYCLLVTVGDETFSLSAVQNNVLPWSLRGGVRLDENILVSVDDFSLTIAQAITYVDVVFEKASLLTDLIDLGLMASEAKRYDVRISREQLDSATSKFFKSKGCQDPTEVAAWLKQRGLTIERLRIFLEDGMRHRAVERDLALAHLTASGDLPQDAFRSIPIARVRLPAELTDLATQLVREQPCDDLSAFTRRVAEASSFHATLAIEFVRLLRYQLNEFAPNESEFPVGKVFVRSGIDNRMEFMQVLGHADTPSPTQVETRRMNKAVREWYEQQRARANIEWNWGKASSGMWSLR